MIFLRTYPVKIHKQAILGPYIADFFCEAAKLIIELDGSQHYEEAGQEKDAVRSKFLEDLGLEVVRYSNREIHQEFEKVCADLDARIRSRIRDWFPYKKAGTDFSVPAFL